MLTKRRFMQLICAFALVVALPIGAARAAAPRGSDVAELFRDYYDRHQGIRVLGYPLTDLAEAARNIDSAVEEQSSTTHQIADNMKNAMSATARVSDEMAAVQNAGWRRPTPGDSSIG